MNRYPDDPDTHVFHKAVQVSGLAHAFIAMFSRGRPRHQPISGRSLRTIRAIGKMPAILPQGPVRGKVKPPGGPDGRPPLLPVDPRPRRSMAPRWKHRAVGGSPAGPRSSRWPSPLSLSAGFCSCSYRGRELNRRRRNDGAGRMGRGRSARARRSGLAHYRARRVPVVVCAGSSVECHASQLILLVLSASGRAGPVTTRRTWSSPRPEDRRRRAPGRRTATPRSAFA